MNATAFERLVLENNLHRALEQNEFELYYQPQMDIRSGKIIGMEALIRWQHPELGIVTPMEFIPLAEETGLILPIGEWVLESACRQAKIWQESGFPHLRISVNVSSLEFNQLDFIEKVKMALDHSGLDAKYLDLEITESTLMRKSKSMLSLLNENLFPLFLRHSAGLD
jgi:EAL domain-containing protein (putative c-di-GMP-specific phosphodiesterase class I)